MQKVCQFTLLLLTISIVAMAQEPIPTQKKMYIGSDNKIYVNKTSPIYFKMSTSPDPNAPSYMMKSEETPKYANPMYFDTEGRNTLRHNWAVDTSSKETVLPGKEVVFEVYADGLAPVTHIKLNNAIKYIKNGLVYFGKDLKLNFESYDEVSGVEATYLSINKSAYQNFTTLKNPFDEEKEFQIAYYAVDHVGNVETPKIEKFRIDITPPITSFEIVGEKKGHVLSSKASIKFVSKDTLSGVNRIMCSINDGPDGVYSAPIPMSVLKDGKSKIKFYAIDNVGNKEEAKIISASTDAVDANADASGFNYYIDKEPPVMSFEIAGDQYKGKYLFISGRSKIKINATDEKSGVDKIIYSIDNTLLKSIYTEPFAMPNEKLHYIIFASSDNVGNMALAQTQQVFVDNSSPLSKISFQGNQYTRHDTLFITHETTINILTNEAGSGVQNIYYTLDNGNKLSYTSPLKVEKEGYHTLEYFATDLVNNEEGIKKCAFFIDNQAPEIYYHFSVKAIGAKNIRDEKYDIYPSSAMLYIAATDNASGGQSIEYRINGKEVQTNIPVKGFMPGNYEIEIIASDMLKNKSKQIIRFAIEN